MKRLTAYVSGSVQKTGYRAKVADFARMLGPKGTVENLDDSRVKILAEGNEDKLKWFEEAININDNLIGAVNNLNDNLGKKMDAMVDLQRETLNAQENLLEEVQRSRKDLKGYLEQRFEKLESEVTEMRAALIEKRII